MFAHDETMDVKDHSGEGESALVHGKSISVGDSEGDADEGSSTVRALSQITGDENAPEAQNATSHMETLPSDDQSRGPAQRRCEEYALLSKSAKRRVRKGVKKEEMRNAAGDGPNEKTGTGEMVYDWHHKRDMDKEKSFGRIRRWRKRRLARGTDMFSICPGSHHFFDCRHVFKVLCSSCEYCWDRGIWDFDYHTRDYSIHMRLKQPCPDCLHLSADEYPAQMEIFQNLLNCCFDRQYFISAHSTLENI